MKYLIITLIFTVTPAITLAQSALDEILWLLATHQTEQLPEALAAYATADYESAYQQMTSPQRSEQMAFASRFKTYALINQKNYERIRSELASSGSHTFIPETYEFYVEHPQVSANLSGETTLPVNNTRFSAVLGRDTLTVLLDTGGSGVGINQEWVEAYNMPTDTTIATYGSLPFINNAQFTKHPVVIPELSIGSMTIKNLPAEYSVFDEENQQKVDAVDLPEFDIIMGLDTFIGLIGEVEFNWIDDTITFRDTPTLTDGKPFLFYSSKPFTAFEVGGEYLTTVIDTGSPSDMIRKVFYTDNYTEAEEKTWGDYTYTEYTVPIATGIGPDLDLKIGSYTGELDLVISDVPIELLIGFQHNRMTFNLEQNVMMVE